MAESRLSEPEGIAARMRELRTQRGWTQVELARASGIHVRTIQNHERGVTQPRGVFRRALEAALGAGLSGGGR